MTEETKTPLEQAVEHALDVFVYAPIGLLFDGSNVFPDLVQKGKTQVSSARMFGQFAVQAGQSEATKRVQQTEGPLRDVLVTLGVITPPEPPAPAPAPAPEPAAAPKPAKKASEKKAPAASKLSIPDYDSLSASQVVSRLSGLAAAELETVRLYEAANRGRKTILNKIAQLQK